MGTLPKTIKSLSNQSVSPDEVHITFSEAPFGLDKGIHYRSALKLERRLSKFDSVFVHREPNRGPYRSFLTMARRLKELGPQLQPMLLRIDDDRVYDPTLVEDLLAKSGQVRVASTEAREMVWSAKGFANYNQFPRAQATDGVHLIPLGFGGVMYPPELFPTEEDLLAGFRICPYGDDLFMKWWLSLKGLSHVYLTSTQRNQNVPSRPQFLDRKSLWRSFNRFGGNDDCITELEKFFIRKHGFSLLDYLLAARSIH